MGNSPELVMNATAQQTPGTEQAVAANPISQFGWLSMAVSLESPLLDFKVRDLLALRIGTVVQATSLLAGRIPLLVNGKRVACAHLEVSGNQLAARITELT
jgi:flagellar motor switch/type III secretory pathway protein FliN